VPFFIINNEYGLSGAVPAAQLKEAVIDVASKIA
jgi:predicted DsbA family dithiol-disulfide isomerase